MSRLTPTLGCGLSKGTVWLTGGDCTACRAEQALKKVRECSSSHVGSEITLLRAINQGSEGRRGTEGEKEGFRHREPWALARKDAGLPFSFRPDCLEHQVQASREPARSISDLLLMFLLSPEHLSGLSWSPARGWQ